MRAHKWKLGFITFLVQGNISLCVCVCVNKGSVGWLGFGFGFFFFFFFFLLLPFYVSFFRVAFLNGGGSVAYCSLKYSLLKKIYFPPFIVTGWSSQLPDAKL